MAQRAAVVRTKVLSACLNIASQGAGPSLTPGLGKLPLNLPLKLIKPPRSLSRHFSNVRVYSAPLSPPRSLPTIPVLAASQPCLQPCGHRAQEPARRSLFSGLLAKLRRQVSPRSELAGQQPVQRSAYGLHWTDEYSWVEGGGPAVEQLLQQEAQAYDAHMLRLRPLWHKLHEEMMGRLPDDVETPADQMGDYLYFTRQTDAQPHPCFMRRSVQSSSMVAAQDEVVLDVNELVAQHGQVAVGQVKVSQDQRLLAYTLDFDGGQENYSLYMRDIASGQLIDGIPGAHSVEWAADHNTILYTLVDSMGRPYKVMRHTLGQPVSSDTCVAEEGAEGCFVALGRTKDWRYLTINRNTKLACEVHLLDASQVAGMSFCVEPRQRGLEYFVEHQDGFLFILSNAGGAANYALMMAPVQTPGMRHWRVLIPERPGFAIQDMDMFASRAVLYERCNGLPTISVLRISDGASLYASLPPLHSKPDSISEHARHSSAPNSGSCVATTLPCHGAAPEPALPQQPQQQPGPAQHTQQPCDADSATGCRLWRPLGLPSQPVTIRAGANADFHATSLRLTVSSLVHSERVLDISLEDHDRGQTHSRQDHGLLAGELPAASKRGDRNHGTLLPTDGPYVASWQHAVSHDGVQVPITVAHARDTALDGSAPLLLCAYGAYGTNIEDVGDYQRVHSLLDRGWVVVWAHVRGGGELGRRWHEAGRLGNKMNSVVDLEACMHALIQAGYTSKGRIALQGESAGGLTLGAVLNRQPDYLGAVIAKVPFVDLVTTMCNPDLPLTMHEYDEWGDPSQPDALQLIQQLCPYQNVQAAHYPPVLVTCAANDVRVPYWGPTKWALRLRDRQQAPHPILLCYHRDAGHFGQEQNQVVETAQQYAFLIDAMQQQTRPD